MATMPNGMTTGGGEVQEFEGDGEPDIDVSCSSAAVDKATAHFHKISHEMYAERCRTLEVALWKLANECDAMRAFEADIRAVCGNVNWSVLRLRVDEARELLKPIPEDILRAAALKTPNEDLLLATGKAG